MQLVECVCQISSFFFLSRNDLQESLDYWQNILNAFVFFPFSLCSPTDCMGFSCWLSFLQDS